jgi:hypothetical protein
LGTRHISEPTVDVEESYGFAKIQKLAESFRFDQDERSLKNAGMSTCEAGIPWLKRADV